MHWRGHLLAPAGGGALEGAGAGGAASALAVNAGFF